MQLASALLLASTVLAWPNPEEIKGTIPNHTKDLTLDPTLIRRASDNKLFLYTTGNNVWTSDSLYGPWTQSDQKAFNEPCGAPSLYDVDGTYYLFYSHAFNYSSIGVTNPDAAEPYHDSSVWVRTSTTLEPGSWELHGRLNITWEERYNILSVRIFYRLDLTKRGSSRSP
jgi:arabinan endo-1,5-alpha-L-arabinosidase